MIRPVFLNASVILLFVLPMITMRTYSEEKRSGTIELLLTSPLTDFQIIMGKFVGAMALYAAMLAVTFVHMAVLFVFGKPEWLPIVTGYLGHAADGRLLHLGRTAHLEHDEEPDRGGDDHLSRCS
jgi:ABC-2 type transport system permease protein